MDALSMSNGSDSQMLRNEMMKAKLAEFQQMSPNIGKKNLSKDELAQMEKASRGFEAMFMNMMIKEMKSTMLDKTSMTGESEGGEGGGALGFGSDVLEGYGDMMMADEMSKKGTGMGIAELVFSQLTNGYKLGAITSGTSDNGRMKIAQPQMMMPMAQKFPHPLKVAKNPNAVSASGMQNSPLAANIGGNVANRLNAYAPLIDKYASQFGLDKNLVKSVISAESAGKVNAQSSVGAKGLMQLMDGTAKDMGVTNSFDPSQNIYGGTKYLSSMLEKYEGDLDKALAAYNAGPGNVDKYGGVPPFKETQEYIRKVKHYLANFESNNNQTANAGGLDDAN